MEQLNTEEIAARALETAEKVLMEKPLYSEMILKQLLKCFPDNERGLQLMTIVQQKLGCYDKSIEYCERALELDPENADNHNNLALAYAGIDEMHKGCRLHEQGVEARSSQLPLHEQSRSSMPCHGEPRKGH
jgi:tetratricopeptide (TPR) repeat protein